MRCHAITIRCDRARIPARVRAVQPPPAGAPAPEPQLQREELRGDVLVRDVQDVQLMEPIIH
ncbi:hypothetical protein ABZT34_05030 [Streptomyces sp. NPDC005329]|uniref:hypothetical protein n=1 Tax=Streptomyces sp. NPDC005329 TaxID=3157034 RepID=UPI0033A3FC2C